MWSPRALAQPVRGDTLAALESGNVVLFPQLAFEVGDLAQVFAQCEVHSGRKNVSFDPATGRVSGAHTSQADAIERVMRRYGTATRELLAALFPRYAATLATG